MTKTDLSAIWADAVAMGKANRQLIAPLAGLFLFLPSLIADQFLTGPPPVDPAAATGVMMERLATFAQENWLVLLLRGIATSFGSLAILALLLRRERPTVAEAMRIAMGVLPLYVVASLVQSLVIVSGLMLFIVPGLYLIGRLILVSPVAAAEGVANPLSPLTRSALLTNGRGWSSLLLVAVIFCVAMVASIVVTALTGTFFALLLPAEAARIGQMLVAGLVEAAMAVALILAMAGLYRALVNPGVSSPALR